MRTLAPAALKAAELGELAGAPARQPGRQEAAPARARPRDAGPPDAVAEIRNPDFPGERLVVCLDPCLGRERRGKREELLAATEETPEKTAAAVHAGTLKGKAETGHRVGREANRRKVDRHFGITIGETGMSRVRRHGRPREEARLDGTYVTRTSLEKIERDAAVAACESPPTVERAFRTAGSN